MSHKRAPLTSLKRNSPCVAGASRKPAVSVEKGSTKHSSDSAVKPCPDEAAYTLLLSQRQALEAQVELEKQKLMNMQRNLLEFYYANDICLEAILYSSSSQSQQLQQRLSMDSIEKCVAGSGTTAKAPEYYVSSEVSRALVRCAQDHKEMKRKWADKQQKVAAMEEEVERSVINGVLAEQQSTVAREEDVLSQLQSSLNASLECIAGLEAEIAAVDAVRVRVEEENHQSLQRQQELEMKKKMQMDNVENTREQLRLARQATLEAQKELKRRNWVVSDLERQIEWRSKRLRKRNNKD